MVSRATERFIFLSIILCIFSSRQANVFFFLNDVTGFQDNASAPEEIMMAEKGTLPTPIQILNFTADGCEKEGKLSANHERSSTFPDYHSYRLSVIDLMQSTATYRDRISKPRILTNFVRRNSSVATEDFVLAVHLGVGKFEILLILLSYWDGPSSIAVYLTSDKDVDSFFEFLKGNERLAQKASFHLVLEKRSDKNWPYAHNILRNVAIDAIESDYFAAFDVDFIPSPRTHDNLITMLNSNTSNFRQSLRRGTLYVLPAFELFPKANETYASADMLPQTKKEVIEMVKNESMSPFRKSFPSSHQATNFPRWMKTVTSDRDIFSYPIKIQKASRKAQRAWEPYIVGYRRGLPRYWEELRGYGYNKRSFFQECRRAGYTFAILNDFYCIHLDHPEVSKADRAEYELLNRGYFTQFQDYMIDKYNITAKEARLKR